MKNKLLDLNNHLFAQLERLGDETLAPDNLKTEIDRSKAIADVAKEIIATGRLALDAQRNLGERNIEDVPTILRLENGQTNG